MPSTNLVIGATAAFVASPLCFLCCLSQGSLRDYLSTLAEAYKDPLSLPPRILVIDP